ncbi:MAG: 30S ribosomal protein S18 [Candidatus Cloacimonetes bacterium]|nr:30S ribosomal protein S18 [Candidatus Cloacimonadota bacterium]MBS3767293.1 30S ribosomal protein S18 [Candidatus Cloacimonadota bacterium]
MTYRSRYRKKYCKFCKRPEIKIDYKNVNVMQRSIFNSGKIIPRKISGVCSKHQRKLAKEIKRARQMALVPYIGS